MNKRIIAGSVLAFAVLISVAAICTAQPNDWLNPPMPNGPTYPGEPSYSPYPSGPIYPGEPSYSPYPSGPIYPDDPPYPVPSPTSGHPSTGPCAGSHPTTQPSASTGGTISYLSQGESLTKSEASNLPGGSTLVSHISGLQQQIYFNRMWSFGPAGVYYGQRANTIIYNDQSQSIWSYEKYPSGYNVWQHWGYWYPGFHHAWFGGDARGWHQIAIWGSRSGWSNVIWIYVW